MVAIATPWGKPLLKKGVGLFYDEEDPTGTDTEADDGTGIDLTQPIALPPPVVAQPEAAQGGAGGAMAAPGGEEGAKEGGGFEGFGGIKFGGNLRERAQRMQALGAQQGPADPFTAMARVVNSIGGAYLASKADKQEGEARAAKAKAFKDAISGKRDPQEVAQAFVDSGDPDLVDKGLQIQMQLLMKPPQKAKAWAPFDANGDGRPDYLKDEGSGDLKPLPRTLEEEMQLRAAGRSTSSSTVVLPAAESEYAKASGKAEAERDAEIRDGAKKARGQIDQLNQLDLALKQLEKAGQSTGYGTQVWTDAVSAAQAMGIKLDKPQNQTAREIIRSIGNRLTLQMRDTSSGQGMPGAMSDADREFLAKIPPGLDKSPGYNAFMAKVMRRQSERAIRLRDLRSRWVMEQQRQGRPIVSYEWEDVQEKFLRENPIGTQEDLKALVTPPRPAAAAGAPRAPGAPGAPPKPVAPQFQDGQTFTDPRTGKKFVRRGGKWVPTS